MNHVLSVFSPRAIGVEPQSIQEENGDRYSSHLALILEVIPDVQLEHAMKQIKTLYPTYGDQVAERIIRSSFDNPSYPRIKNDDKGNRKASSTNEVLGSLSLRVRVDYANVDRPKPPGKNYKILALNQLYTDFPSIPGSRIRQLFASNNELYTPTHNQLTAEMETAHPPSALKALRTTASIRSCMSLWKLKQKQPRDEDFDEERASLLLRNDQAAGKDRAIEKIGTSSNVSLEGEGDLECECCFSSTPFHNMIQCPDTHLFCKECMLTYASNLLTEHNFEIVCMSQSDCKLAFPESELKRFLTPRLLSLYERVKQVKEIEMAELDGLEECPHCDFKLVIDNPTERLFICRNRECRAMTCRQCKKPNHLPRTCAEMAEEDRINAGHVIEEAMTNALLRKCPKCKRAFVKEQGCNVVTCKNCRTTSCYICRKVISGHGHFDKSKNSTGECPLWDEGDRHEKDVEEARVKALEEQQKEQSEKSAKATQAKLPRAVAGSASGSNQQQTLYILVSLSVAAISGLIFVYCR